MRHPAESNILGYIPPGRPYSDTAVNSVRAIFGIGERLERRRAEIETDQNLSPAGRQAALAEFVRKTLAKDYAGASRPIRKALEHAAGDKAGLRARLQTLSDGKDPRRAEARAYLRSLDLGERMQALIDDPTLLEAALDASPRLSGLHEVPEIERERLTDSYLEAKHGPKLKEIGEIESTFQAAASAVWIVRKQLEEASGLLGPEFENLMLPIEAQADA